MPGRKSTQVRRARSLRLNQTDAERRLWQKLRDRCLAGFKFVRQEPIGSYFAGFVRRERSLVVEVDGATHSTEEELASDARRTAFLERKGFRILQATNAEVYENLDGMLDTILAALGASGTFSRCPGAPHPNPLPASGERES